MVTSYPQTASKGQRTQRQNTGIRERQPLCVSDLLVDAVPECAVSCIETFVIDNYSTASCSAKQSLQFLCTHDSGTGFTVGEAGLQCVVSDCTGADLEEVSVYNICQGVMGSIPETIGTITATLVATSTFSLSSSIVQASGSPTISSSTTSLPTSFFTSTSTISPPMTLVPPASSTAGPMSQFMSVTSSPASMSSSVAGTTASTSHTGPPLPVIIGISVAGFGALSFAVILALFLYCRRRKPRQRRRSERWSTKIDLDPPNGDSQPAVVPSASTIPALTPNQRFYAAVSAEEKRRSFWRKSIKPEDIGVAVSPEIPQKEASPISISSERTTSRLINPTRPAFSLFPIPSRVATRCKPVRPQMQEAAGTVFNEGGGVGNLGLGLQTVPNLTQVIPTPETIPPRRLQTTPFTMNPPGPYNNLRGNLPPNSYSTRANNPPKPSRLPLTPTYDNGNFSNSGLQVAAQAPSSYRPTTSIYSRNESDFYPLRSSSMAGQRPKRVTSLELRNQARLKSDLHKSVASDSTTFEEDSTPEQETDKELGVPPLFSGQDRNSRSRIEAIPEERSPIRDLTYPRMPRPAAVSRQAEKVPRPIVKGTPASRPIARRSSRRDTLIRAEQSFIQSDSTSPDRYPAGSNQNPQRGYFPTAGGLGLKIPTANEANRMANSSFRASARESSEVFVDSLVGVGREGFLVSKQAKLTVTPPPPQARLTPNGTRDGDLYFTVEG